MGFLLWARTCRHIPEKPTPELYVVFAPIPSFERGGRKVVFVVKDRKAAEVPVQTGPALGERVQVTGVQAGDKVVLKPSERVRGGVEVAAAGK